MQTTDDQNLQPKLPPEPPKDTSDQSLPQKEEAKSLIRKIDERVKTKVSKKKNKKKKNFFFNKKIGRNKYKRSKF